MAESRLEHVAREMRAVAMRRGAVTRELQRGLRLRLACIMDPVEDQVDGLWALTMSRPSVSPSDKEIAIVRAAFGVPAEVKEIRLGSLEVQMRWTS